MKTRIPSVLITLALICFALLQKAQAVNPPPDGGYPGGNTAEGQNALLNLTSGGFNTAVGFCHSAATPPAASTLLWVPGRFLPTPEIKIRRLALGRF
jgi:hypothetical protein